MLYLFNRYLVWIENENQVYALDRELNVFRLLYLPFFHPSLEKHIRNTLVDAEMVKLFRLLFLKMQLSIIEVIDKAPRSDGTSGFELVPRLLISDMMAFEVNLKIQ